MSRLVPATHLALSSLLHDLGKLAERAGLPHHGRLDAHKNLYCPWHPIGKDDGKGQGKGWHSHVHAAYTGLAWDALEASGHFPDLRRDAPPFQPASGGQTPDSAVNAASAHHCPQTFLQWIVATADRVASGFERQEFDEKYNNRRERDNHYRARLLTLFEQCHLEHIEEGRLDWRYPLRVLSPESVFPRHQRDCTPCDDATARAEYLALWQALLDGLQRIPQAHLANLPLWLDHFDSLWLTVCHSIPSATAHGVKPDVSLYDHGKTTAALAVALWRWHAAHADFAVTSLQQGWHAEKILLVQGDFFGIQNFIFAEGGQTQKQAHKLLRGRSFQVSLLAECAALKLLEALELPPTSQIVNAAGKFLIVAPNTADAHAAIARCQQELDDWCLTRTYGELGVGLASTPAACDDFTSGRFGKLVERLFAALDLARHQRFDLCADDAPSAFDGFLDAFDARYGACQINGRHPADAQASARRGYSLSTLADDQIRIGEELTRHARLLVARADDRLPHALGLDYFGYRLAIVPGAEDSGQYGELARRGVLRRAWDFDTADADGTLWRGYARRFVNSYVPRFTADEPLQADKYALWQSEAEASGRAIQTLNLLACEDRRLSANDRWQGEIALMTLKGDIDNLGELFQNGLQTPTFAKMAALSRQVHAFFALWLPWFCEHGRDTAGVARYRHTYTVFAGGDDFLLIGPWESSLALASLLHEQFAAYVVNPQISFSAGLTMSHPKTPIRQLAHSAEQALQMAKAADKNAAALWRTRVPWHDWQALLGPRQAALEALIARAGSDGAAISSGLLYALLQLAERADNEAQQPRDAIWRSQLHYRLARFFRERIGGDGRAAERRQRLLDDALLEIGGAIGKYKGAYRLPLSVLLYRQRD